MTRSGPHFTAAARTAAAEARRVRALRVVATRNDLEVFAIRVGKRFTWDMRKFGGISVTVGDQTFETVMEARTAGQKILMVLSLGSVSSSPSNEDHETLDEDLEDLDQESV